MVERVLVEEQWDTLLSANAGLLDSMGRRRLRAKGDVVRNVPNDVLLMLATRPVAAAHSHVVDAVH